MTDQPRQMLMVHDLPDPAHPGQSYREANLATPHAIPIGMLVQVTATNDLTLDGCRLRVMVHARDCDGTPLYSIGLPGHDPYHGWPGRYLAPILERP